MGVNLQTKISKFLWWALLLVISTDLAFAKPVSNLTKDYQLLEGYGALALLIPIIFGAITATFIKTAVDTSFSNPKLSKFFISLGFGFCATIGLGQYYPNFEILDLMFPAYILATVGTPVMVYILAIVSDTATWQSVVRWLKNRFGVGDNTNG